MADPIVVVGDALLDVDVTGSADRLCPDAPAPVVVVEDTHPRPGGAALAAALLATGDRPVRLVTALGGASGDRLAGLLAGCGVEVVDLGRPAPNPVKRRVMAGGRCVLRCDEDDAAAGVDDPAAVVPALAGAGAVVASDYGRGVLADAAVRAALAAAEAPLVWDPHPRGGPPVAGTTVATPNQAETLGPSPAPAWAEVVGAARRLRARWDVHAVAVTLGPRGALMVDRSGAPSLAPAPAVADARDTCGAGDAFAAGLAAALARGLVPSEAQHEAVRAAAAFVAGGGAAGWGRPARAPAGRPPDAAGATVVATSGCFDILHAGHAAFLAQARALGDRLVVLLNSDASVRRLKGPDRPLQPQADRAAVLRSLAAVDEVVVFDEDTPVAALDRLRPALFVKGGDYTAAALPETAALARWGGTALTLPYLPGRSTTRLIQEARTHA
ncbi:MAG TPA: PfkB family carbohydrate kinase [Iamia sp.]|nr:PfkB family carbohydrate kinase [Iamia sp.]